MDSIKSNEVIEGRNIKIDRTRRGAVIHADVPRQVASQEPGTITRYIVKSVQDDYLVCREMSGSSPGATDVRVAKPFNLRRTGWHGVTVAYAVEAYPGAPGSLSVTYSYVTPVYRTASVVVTGGSTVEHQVIHPRYIPDKSEIFATAVPNGTGVTGAEVQDINADGRAWANAV